MITLGATTQSLQLILGGATTTNPVQYEAGALECTDAALSVATDAVFQHKGDVSTTTPTDMVPAPNGTTVFRRHINRISVHNGDTVQAVITIQKTDSAGTDPVLWAGTLQAGEMVVYTSEGGWRVYNSIGLEMPARPRLVQFDGASNGAAAVTMVTGPTDAGLIYIVEMLMLSSLIAGPNRTVIIALTGPARHLISMQLSNAGEYFCPVEIAVPSGRTLTVVTDAAAGVNILYNGFYRIERAG